MTQQTAPAPGQYFDVPGVPGGSTQWTEQDDTTTNLATTLSSSGQVPANGVLPYQQTDVVCDWFLAISLAQTITPGTGQTLTLSEYAPYNLIGPVQQVIQNQYASVDVESGIDLYIFDLIRPYAYTETQQSTVNYNNAEGFPIGGTATGYATASIAQPLNINSAQYAAASSGWKFLLRLPASQYFHEYWDLKITGEPTAPPHPALVSPQFMAGTTRVITPRITYNPLLSTTTTDLAPVQTTAGTATSNTASTATGTATLRVRRRAAYAGDLSILPPAYPWQYRRKTQRFTLSGVDRTNIIIPNETGQVLACYVRLYDPAANGGKGGAIPLANVKRASLQYGSGLYWFDADSSGNTSAAELLQRQWLAKHNVLLPPGVFAFDLAIDELGRLSNKRALNTLTTAGILVHIEFTAAQSSTAYAVLGTESLVYVT